MGSKGSQTVQNQAQSYTANPLIYGAGAQALSQAQGAASQPFQMPVAPVAGFNPDQQAAFGYYRNLPTTPFPYLQSANQAYTSAAAPINSDDINHFYNPMADSVTANLKDIFGQQMTQATGNLVQAAGGVGADRIGVAQANLAKQQGLSAGQTYANLYQQALQAAQQQKQLEQGAGAGFTNLAAGATQDTLAGTNALLQSGQVQQQQAQQELNAPYQNTLARIAYPFQTAQYLAAITGGLAPAFGGSTFGNATTTPPQPTALSQVLGLGTAGLGLYQGLSGPSYGGGSFFSGDAYGGSSGSPLPGMTASDYGAGFADGGGVDDEEKDPFPGITPKDAKDLSPIPFLPVQPGAGHSGPLTGGMNFQQPQQQQSGSGSALGDIAKVATSVLPFFLKDGGAVPHYGDDDAPGGAVDDSPGFLSKAWNYITGPATSAPAFPSNPVSDADRQTGYNLLRQGLGSKAPDTIPGGEPPPSTAQPFRIDHDATQEWRRNTKPKVQASDDSDVPSGPVPYVSRTTPSTDVAASMMPRSQMPYPDATSRDWGQNLARSPWMALVKAGAAMASTPGPLGVSLAKGLNAGAQSLEDDRKQLQTEEGLNQKAQALYQTAKTELDKYNRMTPYEEASIKARNREIDQSETVGGLKPITASQLLAIRKYVRERPENIGKSEAEIEGQVQTILKSIQQQRQQSIQPALPQAPVQDGSTPTSALPDPGAGNRKVGQWYIGPSGKPQQWIG